MMTVLIGILLGLTFISSHSLLTSNLKHSKHVYFSNGYLQLEQALKVSEVNDVLVDRSQKGKSFLTTDDMAEIPNNFDSTLKYIKSDEIKLDGLMPECCFGSASFNAIKQDMEWLATRLAKNVATDEDIIECRLAIVNGIRCPKWHEDYVFKRLIKSYYGAGTDWVDPGDIEVRLKRNFQDKLRQFSSNYDDIDIPQHKINHGSCGDVLVISGKLQSQRMKTSIPVLHRSPILDSSTGTSTSVNANTDIDYQHNRRLLYTVSIKPKNYNASD